MKHTINKATQFLQAGQLALAREQFEEILSSDPDNTTANHLLGVIYSRMGQHAQAVQLIKKAIQANPGLIDAYNNLGLVLKNAGKLEDAIMYFKKAVSKKPKFANAHSNLGNILMEIGKSAEAINSHKQALSIHPDNAEYHFNLANAYKKSNKHNEAITHYKKTIELNPEHSKAHINLASVFKQTGGLNKAIAHLELANSIALDSAAAQYNLANTLDEAGMPEAAITNYRNAIQINPDFAEAHNNMGNAYQKLGSPQLAIESYNRALRIKPDHAKAHNNLGNSQRELGLVDDAISSYRNAIKIDPNYAGAHRALSLMKKHVELDKDVTAMLKMLEDKSISSEQKMHLNFGLGKAYEDVKQFNKAFNYFYAANQSKRESFQFSISDEKLLFESIKQTFTKDFLDKNADRGSINNTPIFIVGMPRSGTSLVEQILASHPDVHGAGELYDLQTSLIETCGDISSKSPINHIAEFDKDAFKNLANTYIKKIRQYSDSAIHITDKMPGNFIQIGLIKIIFPNAKIIHCHRNPMANCWSLFKNYFTTTHKYTHDLRELGEYYNLYLDLMKYWEEILPTYVYNIKYEDLVTNQETETKALLEFCEIQWNDACLSFHQTERSVKTASAVQVRQGLYTDSIKLWERYEGMLTPLQDVLKP